MSESEGALLRDDEAGAVYSLVDMDKMITAPVAADDVIGTVRYYLGSVLLDEIAVTAGTDIPEGNLLELLRDHAILKWRELISRF